MNNLRTRKPDEVVDLGPTAEIVNVPPTDYTLTITGEPGHQYNVMLSEQDDQANPTVRNLTGQLNAEGRAQYDFHHTTTTYIRSLPALYRAQVGEPTVLLDGIVTAITGPDEMVIQPYQKQVPAVVVKGVAADQSMLGKAVNWLRGTIAAQPDGRRFVNYTPGYQNMVLCDYLSQPQCKVRPVGIPLEKLSTTNSVYSRIWARVTADNGYDSLSGRYSIVLDDKLTAVSLSAFDIPVGKFVILDGVERNGVFYVSYPEDKQVLD